MKVKKGNRRADGPENPLTIIVARGQNVRYWVLRPWMMFAGAALGFVLAGAASSYLSARSDPLSMQQAYENKISLLRSELDRITQEQEAEAQALEQKIAELLHRQERLTAMHSWLTPLLERAEQLNTSAKTIPVPTPRPHVQPADDNRLDHGVVTGSAYTSISTPKIPWPIRESKPFDQMDVLFGTLNRSLEKLETDQVWHVDRLTEETYRKIETINEALGSAGINFTDRTLGSAGGPFLPISSYLPIEDRARSLDGALNRLETLKRRIRYIPIAHPVPDAQITSRFGVRRDPILGKTAFHAGLDFRAAPGSPVRSAAAGIVVEAGWQGGYGKMVEIDHGSGIKTRYAHLSKILVSVGDRIINGTVIGQVGSSGRSTGPHLHYEIRHHGDPKNPLKLIEAGGLLAKLL